MRRRIFAWVLLIGFVFVMVNVFLFFLNIHLSETHSFIMKICASAYFLILLILLIFKVRDDMQKRNQADMNTILEYEKRKAAEGQDASGNEKVPDAGINEEEDEKE